MPKFLSNKVAGLEPATLFILRKRHQHKCLPVNFGKFFRRPTFVENLQEAAFGNAFLKKGFNFYALKKFENFLLNLQLP